MVWDNQDATVLNGEAPGCSPEAPCTMQQLEIKIVSDECCAELGSEDQVLVIFGVAVSQVTHMYGSVAEVAQNNCKEGSEVVIEIEGSHRRLGWMKDVHDSPAIDGNPRI